MCCVRLRWKDLEDEDHLASTGGPGSLVVRRQVDESGSYRTECCSHAGSSEASADSRRPPEEQGIAGDT